MNSVKLNKKHLFSFALTLVLLFSLNLSAFATTSNVVKFSEADNTILYYLSSGSEVNCTSTTSVTTGVQNIEGYDLNTSVFRFPAIAANYQKNILSNADLDIYTNTKYKYDFYVKLGNTSGSTGVVGIYIFYYVDGEFNSSTPLYEAENVDTNLWTKISGSFQTPDLSGNVTCSVLFAFGTYEDSGRYFYLTDATFTLDDPLINGKPITNPDTDDLDNIIGEYDNTLNQLPSIKDYNTDELFNFNADSYTGGMSFIRLMFNNFLEQAGMTSVLIFALTIGLATYVIGRKVGN